MLEAAFDYPIIIMSEKWEEWDNRSHVSLYIHTSFHVFVCCSFYVSVVVVSFWLHNSNLIFSLKTTSQVIFHFIFPGKSATKNKSRAALKTSPLVLFFCHFHFLLPIHPSSQTLFSSEYVNCRTQ